MRRAGILIPTFYEVSSFFGPLSKRKWKEIDIDNKYRLGLLVCGERERCREAVHFLNAHLQPEFLLVLGNAGGISGKIGVGEIILAEKVISPSGEEITPDTELLLLAEKTLNESKLPFRKGKIMSVERIIWNKASLPSHITAVDIESFTLLKEASFLHIKGLSVKVISDLVFLTNFPLPRFLGYLTVILQNIINRRRCLQSQKVFLENFFK